VHLKRHTIKQFCFKSSGESSLGQRSWECTLACPSFVALRVAFWISFVQVLAATLSCLLSLKPMGMHRLYDENEKVFRISKSRWIFRVARPGPTRPVEPTVVLCDEEADDFQDGSVGEGEGNVLRLSDKVAVKRK
jgi:hypothetical protein